MGYRANLMLSQLIISDLDRNPLRACMLVTFREQLETYVMRARFGLKKYQRGILQVAGATQLGAVGGGTIPSVSDIILTSSGASGVARTGMVFHDDRTGAGSDDGRILTKKHQQAAVTTFTDMGDDDAGSPVDHTGEWTTDGITESAWEVACTSEDIGTWDEPHAFVGFFTTLDTVDMIWQEFRSGGKARTPGTNRCVATFRIREVSTPANGTNFEVDCTTIQT